MTPNSSNSKTLTSVLSDLFFRFESKGRREAERLCTAVYEHGRGCGETAFRSPIQIWSLFT
jgi:hypothetical protein